MVFLCQSSALNYAKLKYSTWIFTSWIVQATHNSNMNTSWFMLWYTTKPRKTDAETRGNFSPLNLSSSVKAFEVKITVSQKETWVYHHLEIFGDFLTWGTWGYPLIIHSKPSSYWGTPIYRKLLRHSHLANIDHSDSNLTVQVVTILGFSRWPFQWLILYYFKV